MYSTIRVIANSEKKQILPGTLSPWLSSDWPPYANWLGQNTQKPLQRTTAFVMTCNQPVSCMLMVVHPPCVVLYPGAVCCCAGFDLPRYVLQNIATCRTVRTQLVMLGRLCITYITNITTGQISSKFASIWGLWFTSSHRWMDGFAVWFITYTIYKPL